MPTEDEIITRLESRVPMPDTTRRIDSGMQTMRTLLQENNALRTAHKQIVGVWKLWNDGAMTDTTAIVRMKEIAENAAQLDAGAGEG